MTFDTCLKCIKGFLIDVCFASKPVRFKSTLNFDCWLSDFHNFICITTKLNTPRRPPNVIKYSSHKNSIMIYMYYRKLCSQLIMMLINVMVLFVNILPQSSIYIVRWKRQLFATKCPLYECKVTKTTISTKHEEKFKKYKIQILIILNAIAYCVTIVWNWECRHSFDISNSAAKVVPRINISTLKRKCRHFDEIFITGCTGSCHFDNFQCSQWWKFHQNEDISVSVIAHNQTICKQQRQIKQGYYFMWKW